jgi:hypothetical protein
VKTLDCVLRDGCIAFRCAHCGHELVIDRSRPFVLQLKQMADTHGCLLTVADE